MYQVFFKVGESSIDGEVKKSMSQGNLHCQVRFSGKMGILGSKRVFIH